MLYLAQLRNFSKIDKTIFPVYERNLKSVFKIEDVNLIFNEQISSALKKTDLSMDDFKLVFNDPELKSKYVNSIFKRAESLKNRNLNKGKKI